jgi:hypothetical protein
MVALENTKSVLEDLGLGEIFFALHKGNQKV